jgi:hypothetical protein
VSQLRRLSTAHHFRGTVGAVSFGLALLIVAYLGLGGGLAWAKRDLDAMRGGLTGQELSAGVVASRRAKALLAAVSAAADILDCEMAIEDIQAYARERRVLGQQIATKLARAAFFLGAALGLIEIALGLATGEVRWTGVACLALGAAAHVGVSWMGQELKRCAEKLLQVASGDSVCGPQTFVPRGP